ncbi:conserved protein of unknown function [Rhodovastum atsumiense]|uniref:Type I-E CRISPR-associated protein Cse1/CasA n=1 Tax=Rhodovastum atsumiense TaxID=504468 RepID=A0A5M6IQT8_9PROT|nr:hypothetical protein [Rhodovastum atsumiense]KAA5609835.1 hypothetical protein F1189_22355 [Rhodovastum atsumiense]CAH2603748.1 conserved protein of unknown function [Rhodovastum atsumiense]
MPAHNLRVDACFPVTLPHGETKLGLGAILAAIGRNEIIGFPGLGAHQRQGWFHFLSQIAALCLLAGPSEEWPPDQASWNAMLLDLAGGDLAGEAAWTLVVEDPALPAFLQPPVSADELAGFKAVGTEPDQIDILVTAKNHDIKQARIAHPAPHDWAYALINAQTMSGYSGKRKYGIARMNGGFGSRVLVERIADMRWGTRVRRAAEVMVTGFDNLLDEAAPLFNPNGHGLLWLMPWNGASSLSLAEVHPYCVEICRRYRLVPSARGPLLLFQTTDGARLAAKDQYGRLHDPFVPINEAVPPAALTVGANGFDYRLLARILLDWKPAKGTGLSTPTALLPLPGEGDGPGLVHCSVLVRGEGGTDGLHDRVVRCSGQVRRAFGNAETRLAVGEIARAMIDRINQVAETLRRALRAFVQGGPEKLDFTDDRVRPFLIAFDRTVDTRFFEWLDAWAAPENEAAREAGRTGFEAALYDIARQTFDTAIAALPCPANRRERGEARAFAILQNRKDGLHVLLSRARAPTTPEPEVAA